MKNILRIEEVQATYGGGVIISYDIICPGLI